MDLLPKVHSMHDTCLQSILVDCNSTIVSSELKSISYLCHIIKIDLLNLTS